MWSFLKTAAAMALVIACVGTAPAGAQMMTGVPPLQPLALPSSGAPEPTAAPADRPRVLMVDTVPPPVPMADLLHRLPSTLEGFRVGGEGGDLQWPMYVTAAQATGHPRFRLGYLSAVSILEDVSTITVMVNGASVGTTAIHAPRTTKIVDFAIPPGVLKPGYNAVSLSVHQRHRVDCSVAATYELWTRIDPTETGLVIDGAESGSPDLADLPGLPSNADGTMPIRVVLAGKTNPGHLRQLIAATQRIAINGKFLQPAVDFGPFATDAHGLNLVLGTRDSLKTLPQLGDLVGDAGPLVRVVSLGEGQRPTLIVAGSSEAELDQAIEQLAVPGAPIGTAAGLAAAALHPGLPMVGDQHVRLKDFGIVSREFSSRSMRQGINFILPADVLPADYARASFNLAGAYAAGLSRDAQVRVEVNGHDAGQVKLPKTGGDVLRRNQVFLPLSLMRPGLNHIDIAAETPRLEDATCEMPVVAGGDKRFLLLDSSELVMPVLARVQRLPDLALMTSGGLPYANGLATLVVPKPDRDTMASALSVIARMAVSAGVVTPFQFSLNMPKADIGSTLVVSPAQSLDPAVMADVGLDPKVVEQAWHDRPHVAPIDGAASSGAGHWWGRADDAPSACHVPAPPASRIDRSASVPSTVAPKPTVTASDDMSLLDHWASASEPSFGDRLASVSRSVSAAVVDAGTSIWRTGSDPKRPGMSAQASLILAQGMAGATGHVTTIVTAPDPATLRASISCLGNPMVWSQVHGRISALDASDGTITNTEADHQTYLARGPLSIANSRLVIAGWFSLNPLAFVLVTLITALCLSGTTLLFVRGIGRRSK